MTDVAMDSLAKQLDELGSAAAQAIEAAADAEALEALRVTHLGKKSELNEVKKLFGKLAPEERPLAGKAFNAAKTRIEAALTEQQDRFAKTERERRLVEETIDVTLPGRPTPVGHAHPMRLALKEITDILCELGFEVVSGPDLEDDFHNFEALNIPDNHPARDMQDTFYLNGGGLLRTHTSPVQIRTMQRREPPLAIIAPGHVYRVDADSTHSPMFTQIEGLLVDEGVRMSDLKGVLERLIHRFFGEGRPYRLRPSFFPFTEPSAEVDILWQREDGSESWMEVLGAGMVHPAVFENVGYDSKKVSGFAFGLGIERFAMLKYGIPNIRYFYENDLRFLRQF